VRVRPGSLTRSTKTSQMNDKLTARIECLLRDRWVEPPSATLAQRIIRKALDRPIIRIVGVSDEHRQLRRRSKVSKKKALE
jgi:hypothetical protein